jgi:hypothetical protein
LKPIVTPSTAQAKGDGKFEHLQTSVGIGGLLLFDTKTGDVQEREEGQGEKTSASEIRERKK